MNILEELGLRVRNGELTWNEARDEYQERTGENITTNNLKVREYKFRKEKNLDAAAVPEGSKLPPRRIVHSSKGTLVEDVVALTDEEKQDQYKVLDKLGWDSENWEITSLGLSNWEQHTKSEGTKNLYAVKLQMKPRQVMSKEQSLQAIIELLDETNFKQYEFEPTPKKEGLDDDKLILFNPADFHWNSYVDELTTGNKWNREISSKVFERLIQETLKLQERHQAAKIMMTVGNDFLHIDSSHYSTTRGTPQLTDGSYKEGYKGAFEIYIKTINTFREHFNEVEIVLEESNHAQDSDFTMYLALQRLYANDPKVVVEDNFEPTQARVFGKTMIVLNHGDTGLAKKPGKLADMFSEEYGQTKHRYVILSHIHTGKEHYEDSGFNVHSMPTLYPSNEWAKKNGFVSSQLEQRILVFDKKYGMTGMYPYSLSSLQEKEKVKCLKGNSPQR